MAKKEKTKELKGSEEPLEEPLEESENLVEINVKEDKEAEIKKTQAKLQKQRNKKEQEEQKEKEKTQKEIEGFNKKYKLDLVSVDELSSGKIEWVDTGMPEFNKMLSSMGIWGWPRGRMVELFGPEGSGKTYALVRTYAKSLQSGLKCLHIDAEGTYHLGFSALHGVDNSKMHISEKDCCEDVMDDIEAVLLDNIYDVIGVDSLASLVPRRTTEGDMGKENYGNLAASLSRCYPRVNSALKKSKTALIFINQLRDDVAAAGKRWLEPEKTPGGRVVKFYASIRVDVRRSFPDKESKPEMFENGRKIGHIIKCKTVKNKVYEPFHKCECDLMYKKPSRTVLLIKEAIETDVIERQRAASTGNLHGKTLIYKDKSTTPVVKYDAYHTYFWLKENNLLISLLADMGVDDFDEFIESGEITQEQVEEYLILNCK